MDRLQASGLVDIVNSRRMVRSFSAEALDPQRVERHLRLALAGPSAGNTQPVTFVVLDGAATEQYWDTTLPEHRRGSFSWPGLLRAPILVLPYVDPSRYVARYGEADKAHTGLGDGTSAWTVPYWWVDGGAAVQTLLLSAVADGLGACFFGQFEHEAALRLKFGVPESLRALGTVAIGYPDGFDRSSRSAQRPRRSSNDTIRWQHWNQAAGQRR